MSKAYHSKCNIVDSVGGCIGVLRPFDTFSVIFGHSQLINLATLFLGKPLRQFTCT